MNTMSSYGWYEKSLQRSHNYQPVQTCLLFDLQLGIKLIHIFLTQLRLKGGVVVIINKKKIITFYDVCLGAK